MSKSKEVSEKFNFLKPIEYRNMIRLGNKYDGGYVVPDDLTKKTDVLISFGYGYDATFEYDYIRFTSNKVYIYDYSCNLFYLVKLFLKYLKRFFIFKKKFKDVKYHYTNLKNHLLFIQNKMINFQKRKIISRKSSKPNAYVMSHSAGEIPLFKKDITIKKIFDEINFQNVFLKCDIEGSEYYIIDDILEYHNRIDIITVEFHWVDKNLELFSESIKKLLEHFSIVHIHGNNHNPLVKNINIPEVPEITLVNNKFINEKKYVTNFPRQNLDNPNNFTIADLFFHFK
jgi:hypothetical protein